MRYLRTMKVLCVFCGTWYDWNDPGDTPEGGYIGAGCCGAIGCQIEGVAEQVKIEKWSIAMAAQGREVPF